eukprot:m.28955 g.28955  ORF g.28955 m.28955 type:complete len:395 (+) comp4615_c0_seq2:339-1523(+)
MADEEVLAPDTNTYVKLGLYCFATLGAAVLMRRGQLDAVALLAVISETAAVGLYIFGILKRADSSFTSARSCDAMAYFFQLNLTAGLGLAALSLRNNAVLPPADNHLTSRHVYGPLFITLATCAALPLISLAAFRGNFTPSAHQCVPAPNGPMYLLAIPCFAALICGAYYNTQRLRATKRTCCKRYFTVVSDIVNFVLLAVSWVCAYAAVTSYRNDLQILWTYLGAPIVLGPVAEELFKSLGKKLLSSIGTVGVALGVFGALQELLRETRDKHDGGEGGDADDEGLISEKDEDCIMLDAVVQTEESDDDVEEHSTMRDSEAAVNSTSHLLPGSGVSAENDQPPLHTSTPTRGALTLPHDSSPDGSTPFSPASKSPESAESWCDVERGDAVQAAH